MYLHLISCFQKFGQPHIRPNCDLGAALQGSKTHVCFHWWGGFIGGRLRWGWVSSVPFDFVRLETSGHLLSLANLILVLEFGNSCGAFVCCPWLSTPSPPPPRKKTKNKTLATQNRFCETYRIISFICMLSKLVLMPVHCFFTREISNTYCFIYAWGGEWVGQPLNNLFL